MALTAAILISRQPLRPSGRTAWVARTAAAVQLLRQRQVTVCSSIGLQTWELITSLASLLAIPLNLYLVTTDREFPYAWNAVFQQYDLRPELVEIVGVTADPGCDKEALLMKRDRMVVEAANILVPIFVRPAGHMASLLEEARLAGKEIITDFQLSEATPNPPLAYRLSEGALNPALGGLDTSYVIHWTRTANSAWPGERMVDYYASVVASSGYPRTALETLRRIVSSRTIIASPRHMPRNVPTVAFSELSPCEVVPLMKWRARYSEMTLEPYGIGIRKDIAEQCGVQPVRYISGKRDSVIADEEPWLWQGVGVYTDWRQEKEHRHRGDFDLRRVPDDALILFCRCEHEAEQLRQEFGLRVVPFTTVSA